MNKLFITLSILMGVVVLSSNYLVQFPINYYGLSEILTYGAFSYPVAFLITDLSNRRYGKNTAKKIVYLGFALGVFLTLYFSTNFSGKSFTNIVKVAGTAASVVALFSKIESRISKIFIISPFFLLLVYNFPSENVPAPPSPKQ